MNGRYDPVARQSASITGENEEEAEEEKKVVVVMEEEEEEIEKKSESKSKTGSELTTGVHTRT